MTQAEQAVAFSEGLDSLIDQYANEFDLTCVEMIGVLEVKKHELCAEALEPDEDEDDGYDDDDDEPEFPTQPNPA